MRDYAQVRADGTISDADQALAMLEIDKHGLDEMDKSILETIIVKFSGGQWVSTPSLRPLARKPTP